MKRGEVWWANLPDPRRRRPVVLLARDEAYDVLSWVVAVPITTNIRSIPSAVALDPAADGMPRACAVALDNMQTVRTSWLDARITTLSSERMAEIERALHFALDLSF